jgi:hypothetical protein
MSPTDITEKDVTNNIEQAVVCCNRVKNCLAGLVHEMGYGEHLRRAGERYIRRTYNGDWTPEYLVVATQGSPIWQCLERNA